MRQMTIGIKLFLIAASMLLSLRPGHAQQPRMLQIWGWHGNTHFIFQKENRYLPHLIKEYEFQERLLIRNRGFILTPRFITFQWSGSFGLLQEKIIDPRLSRAYRSRLVNQTFTSTIFPNSSHMLSMTYTHGRNYKNLDFGGINKYRIKSFQATLDLTNLFLVSRFFAASRSTEDLWSRAGYSVFRKEKRTEFRYRGTRDNDNTHLRVSYNFYRMYNRQYEEWSYYNHIANATVQHAFGLNQQHQSDSEIILQFQRGYLNYGDVRIKQRLDLQLFPWLKSTSTYNFVYRSTRNIKSTQNSFYSGLNYSLYKSLKAGVAMGAVYGFSNAGDYYNRSVNTNISYTKRLPLSSQIQISYTRNYALTNRETQSVEQQVLNERHVIIGQLPFTLEQRNIIPNSIEIISEKTRIRYEEGELRDYTVRVVGDMVEIHINPLGRIPENDVLLVNYRYMILPTVRYNINTTTFNTSFTIGRFVVYHFKALHDIDILKGDASVYRTLRDFFTRSTGIRFGQKLKKLGFLFMAEKKVQDSALLSYNSLIMRSSFTVQPRPNLALAANLEYLDINYYRDSLSTRIYNMKTNLRWSPTMDLQIQVFGNVRLRDDSQRSKETILEYGGFLQRQWPIMWIRLSYERRNWDFGLRYIDDRRLMVEIFRKF
ncbi:MAG: hypothetical protein Q9P90_01640 [candidate division KSB1 bacterium]|nr:hypothetical protein [candidate division KSB1 bacterium]